MLPDSSQSCGRPCQNCQIRTCVSPTPAYQSRLRLAAFSRRNRCQSRRLSCRKPASTVARSTVDRAHLDDDAAVLDSLQTAFSDDAQQSTESSSASEPAASKHVAVLKASKQHRHPVQEKQRALAEYMRLPASQYSVLDAKKIERIDDDVFMCYVGGLNFLGFTVNPVLKVSVIVHNRGPVVKLLETKLEGSKAVEAANDRFTATMTNIVTWEESDQGTKDKLICSDTSIQVALEVPRWARIMPIGAIESTGCRVMQTVLNSAVPKFLQQLQKDYELWAAGDESRKPVGTGEL